MDFLKAEPRQRSEHMPARRQRQLHISSSTILKEQSREAAGLLRQGECGIVATLTNSP
jgi:hypothetical protein